MREVAEQVGLAVLSVVEFTVVLGGSLAAVAGFAMVVLMIAGRI